MNKFKQLFLFLRYVANTFYENRCLRSASALTYTTLLSLVPLTAVVFSVFAAFPMFESFAGQIQYFVFENFVPTSSEAIQQYLEEFSAKTSTLTAIGAAGLILSALLMMNTIEGAINDIWHITGNRKAIPKFMVYWAMLTLGPILIGASLAITSYLTSLPFLSETAFVTDIKATLLGLLPFLATTMACTLLYSIVPNTYVPLRNAFIGATIAAILFEIAKKGFALYVTAFPTYQMIYGALATIPIFLVWLYLSWMVVMLGAEISYCLTHKHGCKQDIPDATGIKLLNDFKLIGLMWRAQLQEKLLTEDELYQDKSFGAVEIQAGLERLQKAGVIHQTLDNKWAISKNSSKLTLDDLYRAQSNTLPKLSTDLIDQDKMGLALNRALINSNNQIQEAFEIHLQPIYQSVITTGRFGSNGVQENSPDKEKQRVEPTIGL